MALPPVLAQTPPSTRTCPERTPPTHTTKTHASATNVSGAATGTTSGSSMNGSAAPRPVLTAIEEDFAKYAVEKDAKPREKLKLQVGRSIQSFLSNCYGKRIPKAKVIDGYIHGCVIFVDVSSYDDIEEMKRQAVGHVAFLDWPRGQKWRCVIQMDSPDAASSLVSRRVKDLSDRYLTVERMPKIQPSTVVPTRSILIRDLAPLMISQKETSLRPLWKAIKGSKPIYVNDTCSLTFGTTREADAARELLHGLCVAGTMIRCEKGR